MARLGDIFTITSGGTPDKKKSEYYANGTIPWVKTGDLKNQYVQTGIECITEEGLNNSSAKLFPPNTVLVAMYGATIGACSILPYEASTNQACAAFLPNEKVMPTYLYYFLSSKKEQFIKDGVGGAQPNISAGYLKNVHFDLIPMQQQNNMVRTLDKVSELIALRKEQLAKLDRLVKSRFIELFEGSNYPFEPLDNNVIEMFIGPFGSSLKNEVFVDEEDGFCMVYEQKHAIQKTMDVPTRYVPKSKYEELKRFTILGGDIIVSCRGTIGEIFVVPNDAPMGIMHPSIMKIRLNTEKYNQKFFVFALEQYMDEHSAEAKGSGVKMAVSATVLGQSDFVIPPIDVQDQFAAFVEQTDKSKLAIQQCLDKLELLKKSLMQEYFG